MGTRNTANEVYFIFLYLLILIPQFFLVIIIIFFIVAFQVFHCVHFECPAQTEDEKAVKSPGRRGKQLPSGVEVNSMPTETATEAVNIDHEEKDLMDEAALAVAVP